MSRLRAAAVPGAFAGNAYIVRPECGSEAGRKSHRSAQEPECDACRAYGRDITRGWRARTTTKCSKGLGWPIATGGAS